MAKDANIGLFNESFPPVMDGVAVCVENYARWMQEKVGGVSVITPRNPGVDYSDKAYEVLDYLSVPVPFRHPYVTGISEMDPAFLKQLLKRKFKIVHAHSPFVAGMTAARVARVQKIPLVATFHSKYRDDFSRVMPAPMVDVVIKEIVRFYKKADAVWVPQESVKDVLYCYGYKGPVDVMPNGCDLAGDYPESFFREARAALGLEDGLFTMLFVGQHIWEKNLRLTIEALASIKDLPYRMFFVGTGYAEGEMKELVSQLGIEDKVTFVGRVTDRELLKRYYAAADLFLFPSLYDTDGLVVREAAALGTPSVMLREASASGMLTDGETGFKIAGTLDDYEALLRALAADPDRVKAVGRGARSIVRSWKDIADEALDRYNAILSRRFLISPLT
ncbi:MAG: glycosyltransferase [Bacteroidales bacterium]|nr:glycosyltransferase [Bacteroidales bacterium]MBR5072774.1 glycosyltransferase [Bacteroidales bacterium]